VSCSPLRSAWQKLSLWPRTV